MNIILSPGTQKLLEERMKDGDYSSPEDVIRVALESLEGPPVEELDRETHAAIERADVQAQQGKGIPVDDAFTKLRQKHFGG